MPTNTARRAKLPIMIAAWLLVAVIALIGSGLAGTAQAQASNDSIPSLRRVVTWQAPHPRRPITGSVGPTPT